MCNIIKRSCNVKLYLFHLSGEREEKGKNGWASVKDTLVHNKRRNTLKVSALKSYFLDHLLNFSSINFFLEFENFTKTNEQ